TFNDALVGLVRHEPSHVCRGVTGRRESIHNYIRDHGHRMPENFAALHAQMSGRSRRRRAAVDIELVLVTTVRAKMRGQNSTIRAGAGYRYCIEHDRARPISKQHASAAIAPIEQPRKDLRPDYKRPFEGPGLE